MFAQANAANWQQMSATSVLAGWLVDIREKEMLEERRNSSRDDITFFCQTYDEENKPVGGGGGGHFHSTVYFQLFMTLKGWKLVEEEKL